jgi:hypothetical protein
VAAAQAAESRPALRAACLFAVLVIAKAVTLLGHTVPMAVWSPFAYLWQDVCVALVFFVIDRGLNRPAAAWSVYALLVAYTAINVPVALVLSTPLTWTMIRAAGGPLADAVLHYLTAANIAGLVAPIAVAVALPLTFRRRPVAMPLWVAVLAGAIVTIGPFAVSRVDTRTATPSAPSSRRVFPAWSRSRDRPTGVAARSVDPPARISATCVDR